MIHFWSRLTDRICFKVKYLKTKKYRITYSDDIHKSPFHCYFGHRGSRFSLFFEASDIQQEQKGQHPGVLCQLEPLHQIPQFSDEPPFCGKGPEMAVSVRKVVQEVLIQNVAFLFPSKLSLHTCNSTKVTNITGEGLGHYKQDLSETQLKQDSFLGQNITVLIHYWGQVVPISLVPVKYR